MAGLLDIAPLRETVTVMTQHGAQDLEAGGIPAEGIAHLMERFPEIQQLFSGNELTVKKIKEIVPHAISSIIAAGCGEAGNAKAEKIASALGVDDQVRLLEVILRLTMPRGLGPFVESLDAVADQMGNVETLQKHQKQNSLELSNS